MALPTITLAGNVVADPELRFTNSNIAYITFRVAASERKKDDQGNWVDGETTFLKVTAWRQLAENVAESVLKGTAVIVTGRLKSRSVDQPDGTKQTYFDLDADSVGVDLSRASAKVTRTVKASNASYAGAASAGWNDDPWATPAPAQSDGVPF